MENKNNFQQEVEVKQVETTKPWKPVALPIKLLYWIFIGWWYVFLVFFSLGEISQRTTEEQEEDYEYSYGWTRKYYLFGKKHKKRKAEYLKSNK